MGVSVRLALIAALMVLSVVVDSVYYIMSAATDAIFIGVAVWIARPLIKIVLAQKPERK